MTLVGFILLLLQLVNSQITTSPLERLRAKTTIESITDRSPAELAGQYKNPSKELIGRVGPPLAGNILYLFPDKSYIYCEWADIMPNTVVDKGTWNVTGYTLELKSAPEITWAPHLERQFMVVRRPSRSDEILLVGINKGLAYFDKNAKDDPELMLLIVGRQRDKVISRAETTKLKASLMREGWRPTFFR